MNRPSLTVRTKRLNYDAMQVTVLFDGRVSFISSGCPVVVPADEILGIDYHPAGASWCPFCDQGISHFSLIAAAQESK